MWKSFVQDLAKFGNISYYSKNKYYVMKALDSFHNCNPNLIHYISITSPNLMYKDNSHKKDPREFAKFQESWRLKASIPAFVDPNKGANLPPEVPRSLFEPLFKPDRAKKLSFKHHQFGIFSWIQTFWSWNINELFIHTYVNVNICDCLEPLHVRSNARMKVCHC